MWQRSGGGGGGAPTGSVGDVGRRQRFYRLARTAVAHAESLASAPVRRRRWPFIVLVVVVAAVSVCRFRVSRFVRAFRREARLVRASCSGHTRRPSRESQLAATPFSPSYTRTTVSNVRRLSASTVVVVVHGRRPPLAKASALDSFPENDQAHPSAVQLINTFSRANTTYGRGPKFIQNYIYICNILCVVCACVRFVTDILI